MEEKREMMFMADKREKTSSVSTVKDFFALSAVM